LEDVLDFPLPTDHVFTFDVCSGIDFLKTKKEPEDPTILVQTGQGQVGLEDPYTTVRPCMRTI